MVERTNEQQKILEKRRADLAERRRAELEAAAQLEAVKQDISDVTEEFNRDRRDLASYMFKNISQLLTFVVVIVIERKLSVV